MLSMPLTGLSGKVFPIWEQTAQDCGRDWFYVYTIVQSESCQEDLAGKRNRISRYSAHFSEMATKKKSVGRPAQMKKGKGVQVSLDAPRLGACPMSSETGRRRRSFRPVAAVGILAAALSAGCANQPPGVRVAPENLDFNYAVQGAAGNAPRVMNDGAQTMLVLRDPLPAQLAFVSVQVEGQLQRAAVRGNTILLSGVPRAFSVLLPAGLVNVVHGGAGVDPLDGMSSTPTVGPAAPAPEGTAVEEPDTNWDWGDGEAGNAAARPRVTWGLPAAPQNARARIEDGPLPGSLPAGVPDGMDTN